MPENNIEVFSAETAADIFYHMETVPDLKIVGGCTQLYELPKRLLSVRGIKDLSEISRSEQFIDAGAAVTLNKLAGLGENKLPKILYQAIKSVANPHIRNLATIGGNICAEPVKGTLFAPLLALDAKVYLQNATNNISIPLSRFTETMPDYVVTKIRISTDDWDISEFTRIGPSHTLSYKSASYVFLANVENNVLTGVRIAFSGVIFFRSVNIENRMVGTRLPLEEKSISSIISDASIQFDEVLENKNHNQLLKEQFLRLVTYSLTKLT